MLKTQKLNSPPSGVRTIATKENCPPVRVRVTFRVEGAIVLEPSLETCFLLGAVLKFL